VDPDRRTARAVLATKSETSRTQPSAMLKPITRTGLLYWPCSRSAMMVSRSVFSTSVSRQGEPRRPKSSSTRYTSRSMPGTIDGDGPHVHNSLARRFSEDLKGLVGVRCYAPTSDCDLPPRTVVRDEHAKRTGKCCRAPAVRGYSVCRMHGARGGAPTGKPNGNYRHGMRKKEAIQAVRYVNLLSRLAQKS
jgi:hypothetical protein